MKKFLQASFEEMLFHSPDEGSTRKSLKLSLKSCSIFFGFLFTCVFALFILYYHDLDRVLMVAFVSSNFLIKLYCCVMN